MHMTQLPRRPARWRLLRVWRHVRALAWYPCRWRRGFAEGGRANSAARAQMLPFGIWLSLLTDDGSAWLTLRSSRNDFSICMC